MKGTLTKWGVSLLHALVLTYFTFYLLNSTYILPGEYEVIRYISAFRNLLFGLEQKPDSSRFLFVNVAWDKMFVDKTEKIQEEGESESEAMVMPIGNEPITDRAKLALFFDLLSRRPNHHKYLVVDIFFVGKTEHDSLMLAKLNNLNHFLTSYHRDQSDKPEYPELKVKSIGLSDVEKNDDRLLKFRIIHNDSIKTTPLLMYEQVYNKKIKPGYFFDVLNDRLVLRTFILDYRIRNYDYQQTTRYPKVHLGEWMDALKIDSTGKYEDFYELTKNKIIFVGDFEDRDIHKTLYGDIAGPLILLNAFLALEAGDNAVSLLFVFFLLLSFTLISYVIFYPKLIERPKWLNKNLNTWVGQMGVNLLLLLVVSIISFFVFNILINILFIVLWLTIISTVIYQRKLRLANLKLEQEVKEKNEQIQRQMKSLEVANNDLSEKIYEIRQQKEEIESQRDIIESEKQKSENLLLNILPADIAEELKQTGSTQVRYYKSASILFADVKGFSAMATRISPQELIKELDYCFGKFDDIIAHYQLERIKTIGDCYMVAAGVPHPNPAHAPDIVLAALGIQRWIEEETKRRDGNYWQIRLGIHSGDLVAGVIGKTKFAYDVWGNTVNTASRMESGGEVGKVNISANTYQLIREFFVCSSRGEIEAKNIGMVDTYFVDRIRPELSADSEGILPNEQFIALKKEKFPST